MELYFVWEVEGDQVIASPVNGGLGGPDSKFELLDEGIEIAGPDGPLPTLYSLEVEDGYIWGGKREGLLRAIRLRRAGGVVRYSFAGDGAHNAVDPALFIDRVQERAQLDRLIDVIVNATGLVGDRQASSLLAWASAPAQGQIVWIVRGGREAWLAGQREAGADVALRPYVRELTTRQSELTESLQAGDQFINPYTFAPLPDQIRRRRPRGHDVQDNQGLSGWFDLEFVARTPMLLAQDHQEQSGSVITYPGSSIRGAVRSIHEVLADGCLRGTYFDQVPVHREHLKAANPRDRLARVTRIDPQSKAVTEVELTDQPVWVLAPTIKQAFPGGIKSGQLLTLDESTVQQTDAMHGSRRECRTAGAITTGSDWIAHVTDEQARKKNHPYLVAVGKLTGTRMPITAEMWQQFKEATKGTRDTQVGNKGDGGDTAVAWGSPGWPGEDVTYRGTGQDRLYHSLYVGQRRRSDGWLGVGDSVWIADPNGDPRIKMAAVWRVRGEGPIRSRMPDSTAKGTTSFEPCRDPDSLCPTCAVFGSIDAAGAEDSHQSGYGTHLRFGPARSSDPVVITDVPLPPLGSPRLGAGAFYLVHPANQDCSYDRERRPKGNWGSPADRPKRRQVAGRKFYWHGQTDATDGRHQRRSPSDDPPRASIPTGTHLTSRVWFDNLDSEQLALLLMACQPSAVLARLVPQTPVPGTTMGQVPEKLRTIATDAPLEWQPGEITTEDAERFPIHLGGGKPLGYGSTATRILASSFRVMDVASRYGDGQDPPHTIVDLVSTVAAGRTQHGVPTTWRGLRRVLSWEAVAADRIWYPTVGNFNQRTTETETKEFDHSFTFFGRYSGATKDEKKGIEYSYEFLPDSGQWSQYLPRKQP